MVRGVLCIRAKRSHGKNNTGSVPSARVCCKGWSDLHVAVGRGNAACGVRAGTGCGDARERACEVHACRTMLGPWRGLLHRGKPDSGCAQNNLHKKSLPVADSLEHTDCTVRGEEGAKAQSLSGLGATPTIAGQRGGAPTAGTRVNDPPHLNLVDVVHIQQ